MSLFLPEEDIESRFDAEFAADSSYRPRYNIAPDTPIEIITNENPDVIDQYLWGLVPSWADDLMQGFINARSETAHEKPTFRSAWSNRPCLVLTTGFYEWKQANGRAKEPYRVYRSNDAAFALAGLWEEWSGDAGESIRTVTILTTEPNEVVRPIHDRMPVVLPRSDEQAWLERSPDGRREMCQPISGEELDAYPLSTFVNDPSHDDPRVIEPVGNEQTGLDRFE